MHGNLTIIILQFCAWKYFEDQFMGISFESISEGYSHAYEDLYFGSTLNGSWNTFKELWCYVWLKGYVNFYEKG